MKHGKKYVDSAKLIDRPKFYDPRRLLDFASRLERLSLTKRLKLTCKLGVDSRHADQQVRGAIVLPNGTGKNVRVWQSARATM